MPAIGRVPLIATRAGSRRTRWLAVGAALSAVVALAFIVAASRYVATGNEQLVRAMERGRTP